MDTTETYIEKFFTKPEEIITISPGATVATAAKRMREQGIGCLIVVGNEGKMIGIISERDLLSRVLSGISLENPLDIIEIDCELDILRHPPAGDSLKDPSKVVVSDVMTTDIASCAVGDSISKVQKLMTMKHIRHVPIIENGFAVGMISTREVLAYQEAQERAMKIAAEKIARLSKSFKSLQFNDVVELLTHNVPEIFGASKSMLCYWEGISADNQRLRISRHECPCPESDFPCRGNKFPGNGRDRKAEFGDAPEICRALGGRSPNLLITLSFPDTASMDGPDQIASFCMCDFDETTNVYEELTNYKVSLLRDIVETNLANAKLNIDIQQVTKAAQTDSLTGIGTRRAFEVCLESEHIRASRYNRQFCISISDLDNFKMINDKLGHAGGDMALIKFCSSVQSQIRSSDMLFRFGGDEFILLLPETTSDDAMALVERICLYLEGVSIADGIQLSASFGVVSNDNSPETTPNELVRRADIALYYAKNNGRSQVSLWDRLPQQIKIGSSKK